MYKGALGDDFTMANCSTGLVQRRAKDGQEDNGRNDRLEGEEVLDFRVRNTEEGELEQEVKNVSDHSWSCNSY